MNSPQLEIDYPGTPQEEIPTGKSPLMFMKSPETNKHAIFRTPPSVGGLYNCLYIYIYILLYYVLTKKLLSVRKNSSFFIGCTVTKPGYLFVG